MPAAASTSRPSPLTERTPAELDREIRAGLARAQRIGVGAAVGGLLIGVALILAIGSDATVVEDVTVVLLSVAVSGWAAVGIASVPVLRRIRALLGGWSTRVERIGRVAAGSGESLTPDERDRARRWAVLEPMRLRLDLVTHAVLGAGFVVTGVALLLTRPSLSLGVMLAGFVPLLVVSEVVRVQRLRVARRFAALPDHEEVP